MFDVPARRKEQFYCDRSGGGCSKYFATFLRRAMNGNYTIVCPACGHEHFRKITDGLVTGDRHDERLGTCEKIIGLKTTVSDVPDMNLERNSLRIYQGGMRG